AELDKAFVDLQAVGMAALHGQVVALHPQDIDVIGKTLQDAVEEINLEIKLVLLGPAGQCCTGGLRLVAGVLAGHGLPLAVVGFRSRSISGHYSGGDLQLQSVWKRKKSNRAPGLENCAGGRETRNHVERDRRCSVNTATSGRTRKRTRRPKPTPLL